MIIVKLLKSIIILLALWTIYKSFLENNTSFKFNRFYLLSIVPLAGLLPLLDIGWQYAPNIPVALGGEHGPSLPYTLIYTTYFTGCLILFVRFILQWYSLHITLKRGKDLQTNGKSIVLITEDTLPFTFLQHIVLNEKAYNNNEIDELILTHENSHVLQKHSYDILFIEALHILFWPNFILHFVLKSIKLNHEFLADQHVLVTHRSKIKTYQHLLLNLSASKVYALSSSLKYKMTEKRLLMMRKMIGSSKPRKLHIPILILSFTTAILISITTTRITEEHHHDNDEHEHHDHHTH